MALNSVAQGALKLIRFIESRIEMRILLILIAVTFSTGCVNQGSYSSADATNASGEKAPVMVITSPRHPRTFDVSGNDKLAQDLRWNQEAQTLSTYVTYSLVSGGGDVELDPANYKVLELPFPGIHLDQKDNLFVLNSQNERVLLGRLESGVFGAKVVLNDNVRLSAHRRNNELSAKLIVSAE